jgi:hypothetical protein
MLSVAGIFLLFIVHVFSLLFYSAVLHEIMEVNINKSFKSVIVLAGYTATVWKVGKELMCLSLCDCL